MSGVRIGVRGWVLGLFAGSLLCVLLALVFSAREQRADHAALQAMSGEAMRELASSNVRKRGEAIANLLADTLVNPLYYFDLAQVGQIVGSALDLADVAYVLVYDAQGRIVHDGSSDIGAYGRSMADTFAYEAVNSRVLVAQESAELIDVAVPIFIGDERLGGVRVGLSLLVPRRQEAAARADFQLRAEETSARSLNLLIGLFAVLLSIGLLLVLLINRRLVSPVQRLAAAARQIGGGDYAIALPGIRADEVGELERGFVGMAQALAKHDNAVRRLAYSDPLTGLSNRLAFREHLAEQLAAAAASGRQLALLFVDLDDFKRVNDSLGHDAGDRVLEQVAARLLVCRDATVGAEVLLSRLGGDEFVMALLADHVREVAQQLAERVIAELARPFAAGGRHAFLGVSIGVALYPDDASDTRALLKAGDMAMYEAKLAGKNCARFYNPALDEKVLQNSQIEHALRGAWERGELTLSFQPIHDLANRRLVGAEALLRWNNPALGEVPPSLFIVIAERVGLISGIGERVLVEACTAAQRWPRQDGDALFVAVNVSALQLRKGDLPGIVAHALEVSGLEPQRLHLELTETAILGDEDLVAAIAVRLRGLGVKIWLDDFGTGFSGLSHLRRVPIDGVKIDRSFVADLLRDPDDLALTTAIIAMAHSLGYTVVAEGVESEAQFELLRERGCDHAQGYWLGHPVPDARFSADHLAAMIDDKLIADR